MDRRKSLWIVLTACLVFAAGCLVQYIVNPGQKSCEKQIFAMNTIMTLEAHGKDAEDAVDAAVAEINRLDALLSTGNENSIVSKLNMSKEEIFAEDAAIILERALDIYRKTEGAFDCTIYPLMKLWGFTTKEYHVPSDEELKKTLNLVDSSRISMADAYEIPMGKNVLLGENQEIDFGGIAKGYASDRAIEIFEEYGVKSGMVSLGGNVKTLNRNPEGRPWTIGIRDPKGETGEILAAIQIETEAVVTSGGYERYFEENGETYIHIIDPETGYPAEKGVVSVTIVSQDGMLADALSTALYVMGEERAVEYWRESKDDFEFVLVTETGRILVTEGLENSILIEEVYEIVRK